MLVLEASRIVSPRGAATTVVALSDAAGHMVLTRSGRGTREVYCGVVLRDAMAAFATACRDAVRSMGRGSSETPLDATADRWLDRLAAIGEFPTPGRPSPRRGIPHDPARPVRSSPRPGGAVWQAYPAGERMMLVVPLAGSSIISIWRDEDDLSDVAVTVATPDAPASKLLAHANRVTRGSTLDAVLIEEESDPSLVVLDLVRYKGEDIHAMPLAARMELLEQLWRDMDDQGGAPDDWHLAPLVSDPKLLQPPDRPGAWRELGAEYGRPDGWGIEGA